MTADNAPAGLPADIRLTGLGLVLREWTDDDLPVMVELFDDARVNRWTPLRSPFDKEAARTYLAQARQRRADDRGRGAGGGEPRFLSPRLVIHTRQARQAAIFLTASTMSRRPPGPAGTPPVRFALRSTRDHHHA
ncbi:GNAT family N-acetyltransferase [Streptosporangium subroseum]|uniref:GNAT family N-acetyltransferase n=1 Tax=Streptosporangium subroseum TaxID=106412 RepID=UPI00308B191E|nr:GNAT family N-acetyltransferase [Streptosporangium subroseum]